MQNIKRILLLVTSAISTFFTVSAYEYITQDKIVICGGESGLVFVVKQKYDYTVYPGKNYKDTLSCIGKSVPFYKREIVLESNKASYKKQLEERYNVKITNDKKEGTKIENISNDVYKFTNVNNETVLLFTKDFKMSRYSLNIIKTLKPNLVYIKDSDDLAQKEFMQKYQNSSLGLKVEVLQIGTVKEVLL